MSVPHDTRQERARRWAERGRVPELERMTGRVFQMGPQPERAAAFKLFGNLAFLGMSALAGDIVRLADATGVDPQDAVKMFQQFNPGNFFPARFA